MIPILYDSSETEFSTLGIGKLSDCISCKVTEKRNGSYELSMEYPSDGIHADGLANGNLIAAIPFYGANKQAFRIYKVSTPVDGELTISARHISYQLSFTTVSPFSVTPYEEVTTYTTINLLDGATAETGYADYDGDGKDCSSDTATAYQKYQMLPLPEGSDRAIAILYYIVGSYALEIPTFVYFDADGNYIGSDLYPEANTTYSTFVWIPDGAAYVTLNFVVTDSDLSSLLVYAQAENETAQLVGDGTAAYAWDALVANASTDVPFAFETDIEGDSIVTISDPTSFRSALGGVDGSLLDTFGGEFEWDMYTVRLLKSRGSDNGVKITYGKNLTDFKLDESLENTITGVHPFWKDPDSGDIVELGQQIVTLSDLSLESDMPYEKIAVLDCSEQWDEVPTEEQLLAYAQSYLESTSYVDPDIDMTIDFTQLWQFPGYEDIAEAEAVNLCDTVSVYCSKLNISLTAYVTETTWDVLLGRYSSITLSTARTSSRNSSLVLSVAKESQVRALIQVVNDTVKISASKNYVKSAIEVASDGILMEVSESYVGNDEVRTKFAMDSTDIVLTADYGTITFQTGALIIDADNLTLDAKGNAVFSGTVTSTNSAGGYKVVISNGMLTLSGSNSSGTIDASVPFDYYSNGVLDGTYDTMAFTTYGVLFNVTEIGIPNTLARFSNDDYANGWTGIVSPILMSLDDCWLDDDGYIKWDYTYIRLVFQNGLFIGYY